MKIGWEDEDAESRVAGVAVIDWKTGRGNAATYTSMLLIAVKEQSAGTVRTIGILDILEHDLQRIGDGRNAWDPQVLVSVNV